MEVGEEQVVFEGEKGYTVFCVEVRGGCLPKCTRERGLVWDLGGCRVGDVLFSQGFGDLSDRRYTTCHVVDDVAEFLCVDVFNVHFLQRIWDD